MIRYIDTPTWGIYIPGYSYPSPAQQKKFERMYPGAAARYQEESKQLLEQMFDEQRDLVAKAHKRQDDCAHFFVPTNIDNNHICQNCQLWLESYPCEGER